MFVGRETERADLVAAILGADGRPIALLGPPGIGKSALTRQALHDATVIDRFGAHRWFVRLDAASDERAFWTTILAALGSDTPGADPAVQVLAQLGDGDGLLVLDNLETPWSAEEQAVEEALARLADVAGVRVLASIRGTAWPGRVDWLRLSTLDALPPEWARELFLKIAGDGYADDPDLEAIVAALDGLPLAIDLIARQAQGSRTLKGLRAYLDERSGKLLPRPESVGSPSSEGARVAVGIDRRLALDDAELADEARDDEIGRELHGEVLAALDRLIAAAGRSNTVAEWREAAQGAKTRLGAAPRDVRTSLILRIERLRSLREADERRRKEADPLVAPAEAGVAAALSDAVAAANIYIQTDPYLAAWQQRLVDPGMKLELTPEEAQVAEADLEALDLAEPELLDELRQGRETAQLGGKAAERARAWLAGSWRNVFRETMRQVLASVRAATMNAQLGAMITVGDGAAALQALGLDAKLRMAEGQRHAMASIGRIWQNAEPEIGKGVAQAVKWASILLLARHLDLLPRLGWSAEVVTELKRLFGL